MLQAKNKEKLTQIILYVTTYFVLTIHLKNYPYKYCVTILIILTIQFKYLTIKVG